MKLYLSFSMESGFSGIKLFLKRQLPPFAVGLTTGALMGLLIAWNSWLVIFILQVLIVFLLFYKQIPILKRAPKKALESLTDRPKEKEDRHYKPCEHCGSKTVHKKGCPKNV